ncbi:SAM-dependent methyltransferase [Actinoplanes sp. CA-252034]|uniref:SAM-dependent methyltransferase n=1 Tax=Actinoplanes sp. CA-252034 TaxID=3239906 RepID=UPI003D9978FA
MPKIKPIDLVGVVRSARTEGEERLRKPYWGDVVSRIELDPEVFEPSATTGLSDFSHVEVVYSFHLADRVCRSAQHPRGNRAWPAVGILAQRDPARPNHIGISVCELVSADGLTITVRGLDAVDGTPVLDVKPYRQGFAPRGSVREPQWSLELMNGYF